MPINETVQVILIVAITGLATISVVTGLDKGIRILSELNLGLRVVAPGAGPVSGANCASAEVICGKYRRLSFGTGE